jgi:hypothetical protein
MKTEEIQIVDRGRGPQLSTSRITVLDIFYYVYRGYDFEFIHQVMPSLSHDEFAAGAEYMKDHWDQLVKQDSQAEEFIRHGIAEQKAKGLYQEIDESVPVQVRVERLCQKMRSQLAERNGGHDRR